jgi:UDP-GlcNAc:undecaprenyl-phosphate GlcNAc-1-phosphate transferase
MYSLGLVAVVSVFLAYFLTPFVQAWFVRRGWVDKPDGDRKVGVLPIPRAGGAVIAIAYLASYAILAALHLRGWASFRLDFGLVLAVLPGGALVFIIGLLDDTKGLPPLLKFSAQIIACLVAFIGGVHVGVLHWFAAGTWWLSLPMTLFWLLLCTNAFNLIDGLDGLSGGLGLFALLTLICYALLGNNFPLLLATVPLAGALLGFLPFNLNPASVYLGDSGSYMIGFALGCFAAVWSEKSATLLGITAPLMALAVPLVDVVLVVARRFLRQKPIFNADRLHIHHRLLERGLTPRRVVFVLYGTACLGTALALLSTVLSKAHAGFVFLLFCGLACVGIKYLGYLEFHAASRIAFRGTFRQVLRSEMILQTTWAHLHAANTPVASWQVLRTTASELGFCRVGMTLDDLQFFESFDDSDSTPLWTITIPLTGRGRVELSHRFEQDATASVVPLTDLLHRCLSLSIGQQMEVRVSQVPVAAPAALQKAVGA